jgi:hypothetical protein
MPQNLIAPKAYHYRPQGRRKIARPKKRWREQLYLWRRNGSKGPLLDVYGDEKRRTVGGAILRIWYKPELAY